MSSLSYWYYIVLVGAVIAFYAFLLPKKTNDPENVIKAVEQSIEFFMSEMEQENEELMNLIARMKKEQEQNNAKLFLSISQLENHNAELDLKLKQALENIHSIETSNKPSIISIVSESPVEDDKPDLLTLNIRERYKEIFELQSQGKAMDYIAKKMSMNKGELQLILQLAKQEDQLRA